MGLELLSISLGLPTFEQKLKGRRIVVHSDNTDSEVSRSCLSYVKLSSSVWVCILHILGCDTKGKCEGHGPRTAGSRAVDACGYDWHAVIY